VAGSCEQGNEPSESLKLKQYPEQLIQYVLASMYSSVVQLCYVMLWNCTAASGTMLDATQEMITLGLCNIVGSFLRSMPISGSFTRSAVNNASGVRTPFGGLYTGTN
jgi:MFS superfamily sulfate permease-like transporter